MKILLLTILAFVSLQLNAQTWIQVPDANFQSYLTAHYPAGAFMTSGGNFFVDSDHPAIQATDSLNFNYITISNLDGIQAFENVWYLSCYSSGLTSLPNTLPPLVRYFSVSYNQLTTLPATLPATLKYLYCDYNQLTSIPDLPSNLRRLSCSHNMITILPDLPPLLTEVSCGYNQLTAMPEFPLSLLSIDCGRNQLTSLPVLPDSLMTLICNYNQITVLPALPDYQLNLIWCDSNQLTTMPALPPTLHELICNNNQLTGLGTIPSGLQTLHCDYNQITCFEEFPSSILYFGVGNNNPCTCVPNHIASMSNLFKSSHPLCENNDVVHNPYNCPSASGIHGNTFYDSTNNCISNGSFSNIPMLLYDNNNNLLSAATSFSDGEYYFSTNPGTYELKVDTSLLSNSIELTCPQPNSSNATVSVSDSLVSGGDFGLKCAGFDLGTQSVVPGGSVFPGQWHHLKVKAGDLAAIYGAHCASGISGQVTITVTGPGMIIFTGTPTSVSATTATYSVADFGVAGANEFKMEILTDTTAVAGDQFCVNVSVVTAASSELDTLNNDYTYCYNVNNSFDPNIKETYPETVEPRYHDEFTYTIHFQNTGNAPAFNIQLIDELDNNLDLSTFKSMDASAEFTTSLNMSTRVLSVRFPNIMLADSASDPEGSIGYFQYRVKPIEDLDAGAIIHNTASIYFDYNAPVITNTTVNLFAEPAGLNELKEETIQLYPNPSDNQVFIRSENSMEQVFLYDLNGMLVKTISPNSKNTSLDVSGLKSGVYIITIQTNQSVVMKRLIIR